MWRFLKKFFAGVSEWFADAADHVRLFIQEEKIRNLNILLDDSFGNERHKIIVLLEMYSESYNTILHRIRRREQRHSRQLRLVVR